MLRAMIGPFIHVGHGLPRMTPGAVQGLMPELSARNPGQRLFGTNATASRAPMGAAVSPTRAYAASAPAAAGKLPAQGGAMQHTRSVSTILKFPDLYMERSALYKDFVNLHRANLPELEGAEFLGVHYTSSQNMRSIEEHGFDVDRSGENWVKDGQRWSQDGDALYVTDDAYIGVGYAMKAAARTEQGHHAENALQMMAVYVKSPEVPSGRSVARTEDLVVTYSEDGTKETAILKQGLKRENFQFFGVPMPAFSSSEAPDVKSDLRLATWKDD